MKNPMAANDNDTAFAALTKVMLEVDRTIAAANRLNLSLDAFDANVTKAIYLATNGMNGDQHA